jgi:hypothetical protein
VWVPKIPFRLQISRFGLSDQNFGTPQGAILAPRRNPSTKVMPPLGQYFARLTNWCVACLLADVETAARR